MKKNEYNLGFAKNFKTIVDDCSGKYIAFSDQDDIWDIRHLEVLLSIIENKDIACGNALLVDQDIIFRLIIGFLKMISGMAKVLQNGLQQKKELR